MTYTQLIGKHIHDVHFGGNWTCSNLKDLLSDVTLEEALTTVDGLNTIATLTFHMHYYALAITQVLEGMPLDAKDEYSFAHPAFESEDAWKSFVKSVLETADRFAKLTEQLPDNRLKELFSDAKHGTYFRNLVGFIEHTHYHLGQIAVIKKIVRNRQKLTY